MVSKRMDPETVRVFSSHEEAERAETSYWLSLSPEQRLDAVGECVREYLALRNEPEQRLRRVHRVLHRDDLIANKLATGRDQDLLDVKKLTGG